MKSVASILVVFLVSAPSVLASGEPSNPVVRVVGLLKALSAKIEAEGKAEGELYDDFVCWGKSVIAGKTASNSAAQMRIDDLTAVIGDLDSGATELTSERTDLEKELQSLNEDRESATNERAQAKADFEKAEEEMVLAIEALKQAIYVLGNATKGHAEGTLLSVREQVHQGMATGGLAALERRSTVLNKAVELGNRFLHHADATFLQRLLTGDVPTVDWKKLNRKATFKMSYKARSFKIQEVLANMLKTFEDNLAAARTKESDDVDSYGKLMTSKGKQLTETEAEYAAMAKEKGAKGLSRTEASDEVDALKAQIEADKKFISQTQDDLSTKTAEWKARKELRAGELAAVSKAIDILYNDSARDLMKKSFESQGYMFFQTSATASTSEKFRLREASNMLRHLASVTDDRRILALGNFSESEKTAIQPAIEAIDSLILKLKADEEDDLAKKEQCEQDRAKDTRDAILKSRLIDDKTDLITELTDKIQELEKSIAATEKSKAATTAALAEATTNRNAENKEYESDLKDDRDAAAVVLSAKAALTEFYKKSKLMLLQQPVETVAGAAPTAPPTTWEGGYGGKTSEMTGIIAVLDLIHEDITKDITKAKADEVAAEAAYGEFKKLSDASILADKETISKLDGTKGTKISERATATTERGSAKNTLNGILSTIKMKASSGCDYFATNYQLRASNRQVELDGLTKAKAYLQGGEFSKVDPNREIKPGDAAMFLQKRLSR